MSILKAVVYANPRECFGLKIPLRVQVHYAKMFCENHNIPFSLPTTEDWFGKSYNKLSEILQNDPSHLIVFSELFLCENKCYEFLCEYNKKRKKMIQICTSYESKIYTLDNIIIFIESFNRSKKLKMKLSELYSKFNSK